MMTVTENDKCYMLIDMYGDVDITNEMKLKENIEKGNKEMKLKCLKALVLEMVKGYHVSNSLLMTIIRFLSPQTDHEMKKLMLLFWELFPKTQPNGSLITEMILVVDSYRKDLENPNEYIQTYTLRFLSKVDNSEILESLMTSIKNCLNSTKNFVRRNAIITICTIYKKFPHLVANAPELILHYLSSENDSSCTRNALIMLHEIDKGSAISYLKQHLTKILDFDPSLQLVTIEVMLKCCQSYSPEKSLFLPIISKLMLSNKTSSAVRFEASNALSTLSPSTETIKSIIECYVELLFKESDNNIRLVLLGRIKKIAQECNSKELRKTVSFFALDILSLLSQYSCDDAVIDLNVAQCILMGVQSLIIETDSFFKAAEVLTREIVKLQSRINVERRCLSLKKLTSSELYLVKYLNLLIDSLCYFSMKSPDILQKNIPALFDTIYTCHQHNSLKILTLIKFYLKFNSQDNEKILEHLIDVIDSISSQIVMKETFSIFIFFCKNGTVIMKLLCKLHSLLSTHTSDKSNTDTPSFPSNTNVKPNLVLPDGSYASQSYIATPKSDSSHDNSIFSGGLHLHISKDTAAYSFITLVSFLMVHCAVILASECTNCIENCSNINKALAQSIYVILSLLDNCEQFYPNIKGQWREKINANLHILFDINDSLHEGNYPDFSKKISTYSEIFVNKGNYMESVDAYVFSEKDQKNDGWCDWSNNNNGFIGVSASKMVDFMPIFLSGHTDDNFGNVCNNHDSLQSISPEQSADTCEFALDTPDDNILELIKKNNSASLLNNVVQLTGLSDNLYVEAVTIIKSNDVILDILIVNRTGDTLQNVAVEMTSHGKSSAFIKSAPIILAPFGYNAIKLPIKVTSLENGTFYGNIFYDATGSQSDRNCVALNPIYLDVTDYTRPFSCSQDEFLSKWKELDWENTIQIKTEYTNMLQFVNNILKSTNMVNITPQKAMDGNCKFLVCNAGIVSSFNEEALVNISMEQSTFNESPISGIIRLRAGTEGMVLNIGEKLKRCMLVN